MIGASDETALMVERRWCLLGSYHHGAELAWMVRPDMPVALRWDITALSAMDQIPVRVYLPLYLAPLNTAVHAVGGGPLWKGPYGLTGLLQAWDECLERVGSLERLVYLVRIAGERAILEAWELGER